MSWQILTSLLATVFLSPFVGAAEPLALPLPQSIDYTTYLRGQLLAANFSTDPRIVQPAVAADAAGGQLEAFIINYEPCVVVRDAVAYRLVVRNVGKEVVNGASAEFRYPEQALEFKEAQDSPIGTSVPGGGGVVPWNIGTILPGPENWRELNITFVAIAPAGGLSTELRVSGGGGLVITAHTIPNNCPAPLPTPDAPAGDKQPAILCDPGEIGCTNSVPKLGALFDRVLQEPARQPIVCSPNDPDGCVANMPRLGVRFAEAVASLQPGECSVLEDGVLADPAFQDGLLRGKDVAALFMRPLYDSGQDYSRLVLQNELLGIRNKLHARSALGVIHTKHWQLRVEPLQNVLRGSVSTATIRGLINKWHQDWVTETRTAQIDLAARYTALQEAREQKFDPVADRAVVNAGTAIARACGAPLLPPRDPDGGLRRLLFEPPFSVKGNYVATLGERATKYSSTQSCFINADTCDGIPEVNRPLTWQRELRDALNAFDAGDKKPLEDFVAQIPQKDKGGLAAGWSATYDKHAKDDVAADEQVRLSLFEPALDTPKTIAAACARDTTLAARVEISWCESGIYPEHYNIPEALRTVREALPPPLVEGGESAAINSRRTFGVSCRLLSGDPYWAADCSCNCKQLVAGAGDGQIEFCQPEDKNEPIKPIIRPDLYSIAQAPRTQDECLHEVVLDDHFLSR